MTKIEFITDDIYFFDSDCLSSFLQINRQDILIKLFDKKMHLPSMVYKELMHAPAPILENLETMLNNKNIDTVIIYNNTIEYKEYLYLTQSNKNNMKIGKGEAYAIALAKERNGVLASNNLRDVKTYVDEYKLKHITTCDILIYANEIGVLSQKECSQIWKEMLDNDVWLPYKTYKEYLLKMNNE